MLGSKHQPEILGLREEHFAKYLKVAGGFDMLQHHQPPAISKPEGE
jgi:hypothetical protein